MSDFQSPHFGAVPAWCRHACQKVWRLHLFYTLSRYPPPRCLCLSCCSLAGAWEQWQSFTMWRRNMRLAAATIINKMRNRELMVSAG